MEKYWALDYVDDCECELVYRDQLYKTESEAMIALWELGSPKNLEVNWYTRKDLEEDVYSTEIYIDDELRVHAVEW